MPVSSGLEALHAEMRRQFVDARMSYDAALAQAAEIADRIKAAGRLLMLGMGASHWANRMVLPSYRELGVEAFAEVLSKHMRMPLPPRERMTLLTSQSGNSGEVAAWLRANPAAGGTFGLTMQADSILGRGAPCLVGQGGREATFAATRSISITLALHAAILKALGHEDGALLKLWAEGMALPEPFAGAILEPLLQGDMLVLSSRGALAPVMEASALTYVELARAPAAGMELGQLIHGPQESLTERTALVLVRPADKDAAGITRFAASAVSWGLRPVLFDLGDQPPVEGCMSVPLPAAAGLAAVAQVLPYVQALVIEAASRRADDFGSPRRSSKITDGEVA